MEYGFMVIGVQKKWQDLKEKSLSLQEVNDDRFTFDIRVNADDSLSDIQRKATEKYLDVRKRYDSVVNEMKIGMVIGKEVNKGKDLIIFCGESGVGKDYLVKLALQIPNTNMIVSTTTRPPRPTEEDGREYYFLTPEQFNILEEDDQLLEKTVYEGDGYVWKYGITKQSIEEVEGYKIMILNPDGIQQLIDNGYAPRMRVIRVNCDTPVRIERLYNRVQEKTVPALQQALCRIIQDAKDFDERFYLKFSQVSIRDIENTAVVSGKDSIDRMKRKIEYAIKS